MKFYEFNTFSDKVSVKYSLSLGLLNTEHKPSVKKWSTGPVSDRSTGIGYEFYRLGRVEEILTGSISASHNTCSYLGKVEDKFPVAPFSLLAKAV